MFYTKKTEIRHINFQKNRISYTNFQLSKNFQFWSGVTFCTQISDLTQGSIITLAITYYFLFFFTLYFLLLLFTISILLSLSYSIYLYIIQIYLYTYILVFLNLNFTTLFYFCLIHSNFLFFTLPLFIYTNYIYFICL